MQPQLIVVILKLVILDITACGTWPNIVCKANVTITGCSNVNQCAVPPTCSTCSAGYIFVVVLCSKYL